MKMPRWPLVAFALGVCSCRASTGAAGPAHCEVNAWYHEQKRAFGQAGLVRMARECTGHPQKLAVLGLGRIGTKRSIEVLRELLHHEEVAIRDNAAIALAFTGDEDSEDALIAHAKERSSSDSLQALGYVGTAKSFPVLLQGLKASEPHIRASSAVALAIFGRRKRPLSPGVVSALVEASMDSDAEVQYGVALAFDRQFEFDPSDPEVSRALEAIAASENVDAATVALSALTRRGIMSKATTAALQHPHWRMRVRAIQALTAPHATTPDLRRAARHALAAAQGYRSERTLTPHAHEITEAITRLIPARNDPEVSDAIGEIHTFTEQWVGETSAQAESIAASMLHCRAALFVSLVMKDRAPVTDCGGPKTSGWPTAMRTSLMLGEHHQQLFADSPTEAITFLTEASKSEDLPIRVAAAVAAKTWADTSVAVDALTLVERALTSEEALVRIAAAETLSAFYEESSTREDASKLITAELNAAPLPGGAEDDRAAALMDVITTTRYAAGHPFCTDLLDHWNRTIRQGAADCLTALDGEEHPRVEAASPPPALPFAPRPPPRGPVELEVLTTRGAFRIELNHHAALHYAAVMHLAEKNFYAGVVFHRLVPDFVVQGGDPTGTGAGGPGFWLPAEMSSQRFGAGAVGMADAGLDTGGSQFFVAHGRISFLEYRYTQIGLIRRFEDLMVAQSLIAGDRIVSIGWRPTFPPQPRVD